MRQFVAELRRRNVFRAGALYIASTWALAQGIAQLGPVVGAPDGLTRWFLIGTAIGFPFWIASAWLYEFTHEGLKRGSEIDASESIARQTGRKLDRWIIAVLAGAVVLLLTDHFAVRRDAEKVPARTASPTAASVDIPDIDKDPSVAVLPLVDMSQGKDQEYFSDGISEELLNLLTKVPQLRVIARTSSFSFKGKDLDIADIARKLNVAAVLEGSVRKSGNTVRITVQLIRASDSSQVWSETYDRTLDDIFKVQDEIAATVVKKLRLTLLGATPTARAVDPRAYPLILQAEALTTETSAASTSKAIMLYQQALEIAPDEPRAWSGLGRAYANQVVTGIGPAEQGIALAEQALKKAIAADPNDAVAYSRLGGFYSSVKNAPAAAAPFYEKAMALNPRDETVIGNAGVFLINLGRLEEAGVLFDWKALRDPASATAINNVAVLDYYAGHWERSIAANRTVLALSPGYALAHGSIGTMMLLAHGNAADALSEMQAEPDEIFKLGGTAMALHTLGRDAESDAAMDALIAQHATDGALTIATAFAWRGEADRAFKWLHNAIAAGDPSLVTVHLEPIIAGLHDDPRWMPLLRKLGQTREQLSKIAFKVTLPEDGVKESGNANTTR